MQSKSRHPIWATCFGFWSMVCGHKYCCFAGFSGPHAFRLPAIPLIRAASTRRNPGTGFSDVSTKDWDTLQHKNQSELRSCLRSLRRGSVSFRRRLLTSSSFRLFLLCRLLSLRGLCFLCGLLGFCFFRLGFSLCSLFCFHLLRVGFLLRSLLCCGLLSFRFLFFGLFLCSLLGFRLLCLCFLCFGRP